MFSLRNAFCGLVLLVAQVFAAAPLAFKYPSHPEANTNFTISWSGGVSPVRATVARPALRVYLTLYRRCSILYGSLRLMYVWFDGLCSPSPDNVRLCFRQLQDYWWTYNGPDTSKVW